MDWMQLVDMIFHIDKTLGIVIRDYGVWVYAVLFAIVFCETGLVVFPFLPGDSLLFIAGAFAASGQMNVSLLIVLLLIAAITGNTLNYWIGSLVGHKVLEKDYRWIDRNAIKKTHEFYEKHGGKTVVLARFVPIVRTFAPFVAGISDMSHADFQRYNVLGALLWVLSLVIGGYLFGNIPIIRDHLNTIVLVGVGAAIVPLVFAGIWKMLRKVKRA